MLIPKKTIPKLAVAALALTGCGGDSGGGTGGMAGSGGTAGAGGTAGTGGGSASLPASLNAFCMKLVDCFPGYYINTEACVSYISNYYGLDDVTPQCEAAAISYFDCGTALSCAELDAGSNSCDDEAIAAGSACGPQI